MNILKNKIGYAIAIAALGFIPTVGMAQSVNTTPVVNATTTAGLVVSVTTPNTIVNGGTNVALANIRLDATGNNGVRVSSIPVTVNYSGGVTPDDVTNCRVVNTNGSINLTTGSHVLAAFLNGINTINLDVPFTSNMGTASNLTIVCDVASNVSGSMNIAVNPSSFFVNTVTTTDGTVITPSTGTTSLGTVAPTAGTVTFIGTGVVTPPTTPDLPNTGVGGNIVNLLAIFAAFVALGAGGFLLRKKLLA